MRQILMSPTLCFAILLSFLACNKTQHMAEPVSGLAQINFPRNITTDIPEFYVWLGGKDQNCPKFGAKNCADAEKLVQKSRLVITPKENAAACTTKTINSEDAVDNSMTVNNGCTYRIELGYYAEKDAGGQPVFMIKGASDAIIAKGQAKFNVEVRLASTTEGQQKGFPVDGGLDIKNDQAEGTIKGLLNVPPGPANITFAELTAKLIEAKGDDEKLRALKIAYEGKTVEWEGLVIEHQLYNPQVFQNRYFLLVHSPENQQKLDLFLKSAKTGAGYKFHYVADAWLNEKSYTIDNMPRIDIKKKAKFGGLLETVYPVIFIRQSEITALD